MKVAVIGAGISGLCCAYWLRNQHDVSVFEANDYVGGHTNTIDVEVGGEAFPVDTGFIVFNNRTYPNFIKLLDELGVESQTSNMSFSVRCDRSGLEYAGTNLNGLFAQRANAFRPGFWRLLRDWWRFSREAPRVLADADESMTVSEYLTRNRYSREFLEHYFLPMGSAIWSCPCATFEQFPIRFIVEFYANHGLLKLFDCPTWRVIRGGSQRYVRAILARLPRPVITSAAITELTPTENGVIINRRGAEAERFDRVVLACHADQSLRLLGSAATPAQREVLGAFPYEENIAILHTDSSVLPRRTRAWASWNYHIPRDTQGKATLTYNMTRLQGLKSGPVFCVTLNGESRIHPDLILKRIVYHHPIFAIHRRRAQLRQDELNSQGHFAFCGAYWGNGFHEDGVTSALNVVRHLTESGQASLPAGVRTA